MTAFAERVREVVRALPAGDVVTYGEVAALAGKPGAARGVGAVLAGSGEQGLPWWRVVNAAGRLVPGHEREHAKRLRAEGVPVDVAAGRVQFSRGRR
ncbi:MAG TPA: MGMT family protein [Acidimicrobiales bacterium]|nr:MGMT family protein [Acidimicrobiales bacterium]